MKIYPKPLTITLAAAAAACCSGTALAATKAKTQFTLVERAISDTVVDVGDKGDSLGDLLVFNNPLYDAADKKEVGRANGHCTRTVVGKAWECAWTNTLADGQLAVSGTFNDTGSSTLLVTGGTGQYAGMHGEMRLRFRDEKGSAFDFIFSLKK